MVDFLLPYLTFSNLALFTGALHFTQLPSMLFIPKMFDMREDLAKISPMNRLIFTCVTATFSLTVFGLGLVVVLAPDQLVDGTTMATAFSGFLMVFYVYRSLVQVTHYAPTWPKTPYGRFSHWGLFVMLGYQGLAYGAIFVYNLIIGAFR